MKKQIVAVSVAAGIAVALATTPVHATAPRQLGAADIGSLGVSVTDLPATPLSGMSVKIARTVAEVNANSPLIGYNDGRLFQSLGFYGSLSEVASLPAGVWDTRYVILFATAFPSQTAAQQAFTYDADALGLTCTLSRTGEANQKTASCLWSNQNNYRSKSGVTSAVSWFKITLAGTVEYDTVALITAKREVTQAQLAQARTLTANDFNVVSAHEAAHLQSLTTPPVAHIPAPPAIKPHPTPVTKPRPLPIAKPAPAPAPAFTVKVWVMPSSMSYDAYPGVYVRSTPGATCSANVIYSTGRSPVSFDGSAQTLPANGIASWSWHEETVGSGGTATVDCTYHGQDRTADASFTVQ